MVAVLFPVENLLVHAADHGIALGLLLLTAEALLGLVVYLLGLRVLAPGLGRELSRCYGRRDASGAIGQAPITTRSCSRTRASTMLPG